MMKRTTKPKPSALDAKPARSSLLQRKCVCGSTAGPSGECDECKKKKALSLQTKLKIVDGPGDIYEQEADRIADQVLVTSRHRAPTGAPLPIRSLSDHSSDKMGSAPGSVDRVLSESGSPLEPSLRGEMERRFGHDFSAVRVHCGGEAAESAREVRANAYAVGHHLVFGSGHFAPATREGKRLLAHELTHVVQQRSLQNHSILHRDSDVEETGPTQRQKDCVKRRGGCPGGDVSGIPTCWDIINYNRDCRVETGYTGPDVNADCPSGFVPDWTDCKAASNVPTPKEQTPKEQQPPVPCIKPFAKANSFAELIDLVRAAESRLASAGITSAKEQIHALRGIFYGTTWSLDYAEERSETRNEGFQRFTRPSEAPEQSVPRDVRSILNCGLFEALKASQDVVEPTRHIDFGHLVIALDARYDPALATNIVYPYLVKDVDMGGTGTELVTWLGDLGGGAAKVALTRVSVKTATASVAFSAPSDYGGTINLEGDVAGFVVASNAGATALAAPSIPPGKGLSDALQDYVSPSASGSAWKSRANNFLTMYGGVFNASNDLTNRSMLVSKFAAQIQTFACNYLASRVKDKHITFAVAKAAADNVIPASEEVAEAFIDALADSAKTGGTIEAKRFPGPKPARSGACTLQIYAGGALGGLKGIF